MAKKPSAAAQDPASAPAVANVDAPAADAPAAETPPAEPIAADTPPADAPAADTPPVDAPAAGTLARLALAADPVWMKMLTGLSGPELSLTPRDKHLFDADEAERLFGAGFAEYTDAPEA